MQSFSVSGVPSPLDICEWISIAVTFFLQDIEKLKMDWTMDRIWKWSVLEAKQVMFVISVFKWN